MLEPISNVKTNNDKNKKPENEPDIPWLEKFDEMTSNDSSEDPDIDFITRLHELEGR